MLIGWVDLLQNRPPKVEYKLTTIKTKIKPSLFIANLAILRIEQNPPDLRCSKLQDKTKKRAQLPLHSIQVNGIWYWRTTSFAVHYKSLLFFGVKRFGQRLVDEISAEQRWCIQTLEASRSNASMWPIGAPPKRSGATTAAPSRSSQLANYTVCNNNQSSGPHIWRPPRWRQAPATQLQTSEWCTYLSKVDRLITK